jgi:hypothetical protein
MEPAPKRKQQLRTGADAHFGARGAIVKIQQADS